MGCKVVGQPYRFQTIKAIVGQGFSTVWAPNHCQCCSFWLWGQGLVKATLDWTYLYPKGCSLIYSKVLGPSYRFQTIKTIVSHLLGIVLAPNHCQCCSFLLWGQGLVKATLDWTYLYPKGCSLIYSKVLGPSYRFQTIKTIVSHLLGIVLAPCQCCSC